MEEDVFNALQTRTAYIPGGFDREGRIIFIVNISNDLQLWNRKCLELSIAYLKRSLSGIILQNGVAVIVDAQRSTTRITRNHARIINTLFGDIPVDLYLVRAECFWEKHVEPCAKSHTKGEPIVLPKARLTKHFDLQQLPEELGGTMSFNFDQWLQQRKSIDEFHKNCEQTLKSMDSLHVLLAKNKATRSSDANTALRKCGKMHSNIQRNIEKSIDMGNRILARLCEVYRQPPLLATAYNQITPQKQLLPHDNNSNGAPAILGMYNNNNNSSNHHNNGHFNGPSIATNTTTLGGTTQTTPLSGVSNCNSAAQKPLLPPDLNCERTRIELTLNAIEKKQTEIRTGWLELLRSIREARELASLEEGVAFVTNWILTTAEQLLSRNQSIGSDVRACENLRNAHNALELECRETYGFYAELLYKIDSFNGVKDCLAYKDLLSQRDFMHFVCRSFATRLERRRNILITSLRFFRLVGEYFERTTAVFETLVMGDGLSRTDTNKSQYPNDNKNEQKEDFTKAAVNLQKLKESQVTLGNIEREIIKEGEKLSDMLAMPVKDALGRDLHIDYSEDICNIRAILDTTIARRQIFSDSVELQKLTLEQVTHIQKYELDAQMAIKWMDDLYNVMIKCHSHVGCNIHEIQVQKDELQTFQETGKSIFNYGKQLLDASQSLRASCKLDVAVAQNMWQKLQRIWNSLQAISQEHMTRLRVSAVFHRSVEDFSQQLLDLKASVNNLTQQNSSSGISSASESQQVSPSADVEATPMSPVANTAETAPITCSSSQSYSSSISHNSIATTITPSSTNLLDRRELLQRYLAEREQLLLEVGRMVRLGRLLKTRLKEPFILDATTGKSIVNDDLNVEFPGSSQHSKENSEDNSNDPNKKVDPNTILINPSENNSMACAAIANKLAEIAEVAESLDTVLREVQSDPDILETNSSSSEAPKISALRSNSTEDWQSRSTEDDSFATASEGHFTPHSQSSSFQTASGRTSSFISSGKNSFDASESEEPTLANFDMPEVTPNTLNMSFDSSDQSFYSAATPTNNEPQRKHSGDSALEDTNSIADIEEIHSESVTPTPDRQHLQPPSFPIEPESETEYLPSSISDAPSMELITEATTPLHSVTPEVSTCSNFGSQLPLPTNEPNATSTNQKPNASWRRSKYYENITKQTIKGFL